MKHNFMPSLNVL